MWLAWGMYGDIAFTHQVQMSRVSEASGDTMDSLAFYFLCFGVKKKKIPERKKAET